MSGFQLQRIIVLNGCPPPTKMLEVRFKELIILISKMFVTHLWMIIHRPDHLSRVMYELFHFHTHQLCLTLTLPFPSGRFSPILQTLVHDVSLIGCLQIVSPRQQHRRRADGANHQVERLLQVHLPCPHRWGQSETSRLNHWQVKPESVAVPVQCFFKSLTGIGWTATRYFGSASETECGLSLRSSDQV